MQAIDQTVDSGWLEELLYHLINTKQYDYCYVLHHVNVVATMQPWAFSDGYPIHASCSLDKSGQLLLQLYWPILSRVSFEARLEILQHETLHIVEGHMSGFGHRLMQAYGAPIANMAMDIVVNQKFERKHSTAEGLPGTQLQHFPGFPPDRGSIEYAELLTKLRDEGKLHVPEFSTLGTDLLAGTAGQPCDDFAGKGVPHLMTELLQFTEGEGAFVDEQVKGIITAVTEAIGMHGEAALRKFRGKFGVDHEEFMQASQRPAVIPWSHYLRAMESRNSFQTRVATRRRPSRRHPAYYGHTWRGGLNVVLLIDTSGSMGVEELKLVNPELKGMHARGAEITVIHSDADVAKVHRYSPATPLETFFGRGGTDYSIALEHIAQMRPSPRYVIGYTDGEGSAASYRSNIIQERGQPWWDDYVASNPEHSPDGIRTIWLLPEGCMSPDKFKRDIVPWGKTIIVKREHA